MMQENFKNKKLSTPIINQYLHKGNLQKSSSLLPILNHDITLPKNASLSWDQLLVNSLYKEFHFLRMDQVTITKKQEGKK